MSGEVLAGKKETQAIPERRPADRALRPQFRREAAVKGGITVWRCRVCGYLCAREGPPEVCPICKVSKERFEAFVFPGS